MGGIRSGRHWYGGRDTTENCKKLDVRRFQRDGLLSAGQSFGWDWLCNGKKIASINVKADIDRITLSYRHQRKDSDWTEHSYPVMLSWTPCNYGGERAWFICPAQGCKRRVAKLYLGGEIFACRHCYRLAYTCQQEALTDRAARQADKIRDRLGWEPGILNWDGAKPKGMHWRTFKCLKARHDMLKRGVMLESGVWKNKLGGVSC